MNLAASLAAAAPLGVLVEDLHDASPAQQRTLLALAGPMTGMRGMALLLTSRQAIPAGLPCVTAAPLEQSGTAGLIRQQLGVDVPPLVAEWVHRRALGNPLFTLEFLRFLMRSGHLYSDGQRWHWRTPDDLRVPGRIEALIELTVSRAGDLRPVLEARAIVPEEEETLWAAVAGTTPGKTFRPTYDTGTDNYTLPFSEFRRP